MIRVRLARLSAATVGESFTEQTRSIETATMFGVSGTRAAAPQHAYVISEHSTHGPPISPAAWRSRDHQPPSGTEVRSGPGGPGGMGRRRRLGSRRPRPGAGDVGVNPGLGVLDPEQLGIA